MLKHECTFDPLECCEQITRIYCESTGAPKMEPHEMSVFVNMFHYIFHLSPGQAGTVAVCIRGKRMAITFGDGTTAHEVCLLKTIKALGVLTEGAEQGSVH